MIITGHSGGGGGGGDSVVLGIVPLPITTSPIWDLSPCQNLSGENSL